MSLLMICALLMLKVALGEACASHRFTEAGQCCSLCPAGSGVEVDCGKEDTKCAPCPTGSYSQYEDLSPCLPCGQCPAGVPLLAPCGRSLDTHCDCADGFYLWRDGATQRRLCAACTLCPRGAGAIQPCSRQGNTLCQACMPGTFAEERSVTNACQNCSRCSDSEVEIRSCQPNSDTLCMDRKLQILPRPDESDGTRQAPLQPVIEYEYDEEVSDASPSPGTTFVPHGERGSSNILAYVSVLAAVVLGLLLYVAYKCWTSCKQKQALSKARAAELVTTPEGEKLHSDSGVFLDSHSLQDSQPSKGSKRDSKLDGRLYAHLPPHRKEEVERLLQEGGARGWRHLGAALGYEAEQLDLFGHGEAPAHTLLSHWAQKEGSSLGLLCSALARAERSDVAAALTSPAQGVSVV